MAKWNPWHGCHKLSEGCKNCYVYRSDARYDRDSSVVTKTNDFNLPVKRGKKGAYKIESGETLYTCFTSDFLLDDADEWRIDAWKMVRERQDLNFLFITKRIDRFRVSLPSDWGEGYSNVAVGCTCENQRRADERLPVFLSLPIKKRFIICEPLLERIDISPYLNCGEVEQVVAGGESGAGARVCDYAWILSLHEQCKDAGVLFHFKQTGANFLKDGRFYRVERKFQHTQARKAGINIETLNTAEEDKESQ